MRKRGHKVGDSHFERLLQMATCRETGRDIGAGVAQVWTGFFLCETQVQMTFPKG